MAFADPACIDLDNVLAWLEVCNQHHDGHCQNSEIVSETATAWPPWLIDVREHCIKSAARTDRYVALSYVWGMLERLLGKNLEALVSNIKGFQRKGILSTEDIS